MEHSQGIEPDTKDWTWVVEAACPECGFDAPALEFSAVGAALRASVAEWPVVLARPGAAHRPTASVWSPLEYACHVRDVHRLFADRLADMLERDDPTFAGWDQDEAAVAGDYADQDPAAVAEELAAAAEAVAAAYDAVPAAGLSRTGRRSDGAMFTVEELARYHAHEVVHHAWDVASGPAGPQR